MADEKSKVIKFINLASFPFVFLVPLVVYSHLMTHDYNKVGAGSNIIYSMIKNQLMPKEATFQHKVEYLAIVNAQAAMLLLLVIGLTLVTRLVSNTPNPHRDKQNIVLRLLNANIKNHLHQSIIFTALMACWLLNFNASIIQHVSILAVMFLLSRVIYILGNLFYIISGIGVIRGIGFVLNMLCSFTLASRIFWKDASEYLLVTRFF